MREGEWMPKEDEQPDEVTACFAEERFSPIQYQSFGVGPFWAKTRVRAGETTEQALMRAYEACRAAARLSYRDKRDEFIANVAGAEQAAKEASRRSR